MTQTSQRDFRTALRDIYNRAWREDDIDYAEWIVTAYPGVLSYCTICEYAYPDSGLITYAPIGYAPLCESCLENAPEIFA